VSTVLRSIGTCRNVEGAYRACERLFEACLASPKGLGSRENAWVKGLGSSEDAWDFLRLLVLTHACSLDPKPLILLGTWDGKSCNKLPRQASNIVKQARHGSSTRRAKLGHL
jgi:hypothetical protein